MCGRMPWGVLLLNRCKRNCCRSPRIDEDDEGSWRVVCVFCLSNPRGLVGTSTPSYFEKRPRMNGITRRMHTKEYFSAWIRELLEVVRPDLRNCAAGKGSRDAAFKSVFIGRRVNEHFADTGGDRHPSQNSFHPEAG